MAKAGKGGTRGYMETAMACPGVWLDLDIRGAAHKSEKLPPNLEKAIALIKEFPLEPTILVHSGHGLQAWWLFKELWIFDTPEERKEAQDLVQRFQVTMKQKAEAHGWEIDSTFDLARVLRLPGTFNRKLEPEPVRVLQDTPRRYVPYDFEEYLVDANYLSTHGGEKIDPVSVLAGVPEGQRDITLFKYACRLRSKGMSKEEAEALVLAAASNCTPPFPEVDAREKVASAWKYDAGTNSDQVLDRLPERPDDVFEPETITALAQLRQQKPADYARLKRQLKGKVNLNDLERAVNEQIKEGKRLKIIDPQEPLQLLEEILPDLPMKNMRRPYNWSINEQGIWQETKNGAVCACAVPVILTKRLKNRDTGEEKVELGFLRDKKWQYIIANSATVFNRTSLVQLRNKGLPISSESAKDLVRYLSDLERENMVNLPVVKSTSHMGWSGKHFLPGAAGDMTLDIEESGVSSVAGGYRESGTLEGWINTISPIREHPIARFILAASFATPLLEKLGQRVFIIHLWGASRGGKTAALKAALSVWGDPDDIIASFNATKVGLERLAAFYRDLPLGIDERQGVGDKQGFIESLVYMLGTGKGKARGAKGGGLQAWNFWRTIVLTTGEEPLSTSASAAGIKTRVLELYGVPITNEELASKIHHETRSHFGTAGPEFIRRLIQELTADNAIVTDDHALLEEKLKEWHSDKIASHRAAIALVILADYYASQWFFGIDQVAALKQAVGLSETIFNQLESACDVQDSNRAYDYFLGWYGINISHFSRNPPGGQRYGMVDGDYVYMFPPAFEKAIKDGGYSAQRILRDWAEEGRIKTEVRNNKRRFKIRKYDQEASCQAYFIAVKLPEGHREASDL